MTLSAFYFLAFIFNNKKKEEKFDYKARFSSLQGLQNVEIAMLYYCDIISYTLFLSCLAIFLYGDLLQLVSN